MSQRSKGFGFILMSNESEVEHAVEALHNREVLNNGELIEDSNSTDENIPPHQKSVMNVIETASKELAKLICYEPGKLQDLEWRDLERMLALVFDGIGYAVQLTRSAKDGGKDLIVEFIATSQKHSYYIEVKHWVSGQKVGNKIVQEFLSVVVRDQKQGGILISTSGFSGSAMEGITEIERRKLRLGNSDTVVSLCRTYLNVSNGLLKPMNYTDMLMSVTRDGID
jgi:restriction endonuclease Mrr